MWNGVAHTETSSGPAQRPLRGIKSHPSHLDLFSQHLTAAGVSTPKHFRSLQLLIPSTLPLPDQDRSPSPSTPSDESPVTNSPESAKTITPDTPLSLRSPISGVIDLTDSIKTLNEYPAITAGGFSDIYQGEWTKESTCPGRRGEAILVAVKLLRFRAVGDYEKARKRLNWEVYIWHRLEHPNIVKLFGTSYHMSRPAMIMQWYKNGSAIEYLRLCANQGVDRKALVLDVARGLNYLHTLTPPIIHGDLKGNNVLITDDGHAVLSDFGLAQAMEAFLDGPSGFTPSDPVSGPTRWQAPELIEDDTCQPGLATDVWSFGCTAYEILTGNVPYPNRQRDAAVIRDIQSGIKPPGPAGLQVLLAEPDQHLLDVLDSCWSCDPSGRYSMASVISELESF